MLILSFYNTSVEIKAKKMKLRLNNVVVLLGKIVNLNNIYFHLTHFWNLMNQITGIRNQNGKINTGKEKNWYFNNFWRTVISII